MGTRLNLLKRITSVIAAFALALTGLVAVEAPASATPTSAFYRTQINNGGAPGKAHDFTYVGDKVYFSATSVDHGNAIFSTSRSNPSGATYVVSNGNLARPGFPLNLFATGDYLFYLDDAGVNSTFAVYVYKISTGTNTKLVTSNGGSFIEDWGGRFNFVSSGSKVYFVAKDSQDPNTTDHNYVNDLADLQLWSFDLSTATVANEDGIPFNPATADRGTSANGPNAGPLSLNIIGTSLFVPKGKSDWNTTDQQIKRFDLVAKTWSTVTLNGADMNGAEVSGKFYFGAGSQVLYANKVESGSEYGYYAINQNGEATRIGNWTSSYAGALIVDYADDTFVAKDNKFYLLNQSTGELGEVAGFTPAGTTGISILSMTSTDDSLMILGQLTYTTDPTPAPVQHVYKWTGTGSITQVGTLRPAGDSFASWPTTNGNSAIALMYPVTGGVIMNAYVDTTVGFEPYVVKTDGTVTLLANLATGSEGSSPSPGCGGSTATADYIPAQIADVNGQHRVLSEFKNVGGVLKYSVFEIPRVNQICSFAGDANVTYFSGWSTETYNYAVYKLNPDHTATKVSDINDSASNAFVYNGNYYYVSNSELWETAADGTNTQITGTGNDGLYQQSIDSVVNVGNKVYVVCPDSNNRNYGLFSIDLDHPTTAPVALWSLGNQDWQTEPVSLTKVGNKVVFAAVPNTNANFDAAPGNADSWLGYQLYSVDPANNNPAVRLFDINPDNTIFDTIQDLTVIGSDIYINSGDDNVRNTRNLFKGSLTSTSTTLLTQPVGFYRMGCITNWGGRLVIVDNYGKAVFQDDGSDFPVAGLDDSYTLCYSLKSERGTYFTGPVTERSLNFGQEIIYYGPYAPQAISRMGQAVTEDPATAIGGGSTNNTPDTDDIALDNLDETKDFNGAFGSIDFPDGSGFTIDAKGNVKAKTKSIYLVQASGKIKFSYTVGSKTKSFSCTIKTFGSKKKLKRALTARKLYVSAKVCKLPTPVINSLKTGVVTIVQTLKVKRYYSTTMKAKTPAGGIIKVQNRKMTVRMGRLN